ncbi:MAG: glycosyltransferase family 4 protein, partial [Chloroflexi bacterium]|nr:glycosyltransferase family 4 protein [Chloroflexota bacterium]
MRLVFVCPFGLTKKGTVAARVLPAARALAGRGHQVTVLIPPWDDPQRAGQEQVEGSLRVRHLRMGGGWLPLAARLAAEAWAAQPHVVHLWKPKGVAGLAHTLLWARRRLPGGPGPALVVDSDDWEGPGGWNDRAGYPRLARPLFAWQERWGLRQAQAVTVVSETLESLAWSLGVPRQRVLRLPNALEETHPALTAASWTPPAGGVPTLLIYSRFWEFD